MRLMQVALTVESVVVQVRVYSAKNVRLELELAKREFLQASIGFRSENKVGHCTHCTPYCLKHLQTK